MNDSSQSTPPQSEAGSAPDRPPWRAWLRAFLPSSSAVDARERFRVCLGAFVGIFAAAVLCRLLSGAPAISAWLVAPLGASAVLVFALPASPLAQPWSVIGGNTLSCLIGVACAALIPIPIIAAAAAVSVAIVAMISLRCLHPPGGAMALSGVLAHSLGTHFSPGTAFLNSLFLVLAGMAYNSLTGRRYPHVQVRTARPDDGAGTRSGTRSGPRFIAPDLDAVLARYNRVLDISRDDLGALLEGAELEGYRRRMGDVRCKDVMSGNVVSVEFGSSLLEAWNLMKTHRIKSLPVTDRVRRVIGIVTMIDFMRGTTVEASLGFWPSLRKFVLPDGLTHSDKPEVVGQIMTQHATIAHQERHAIDLMRIFTETGHHHIPIVDDANRITGIVTQSDFLRFLNQRNYLAL